MIPSAFSMRLDSTRLDSSALISSPTIQDSGAWFERFPPMIELDT
jgi:hypothetical protein